ncbi:MAG: thioredoxin [Rubricoccaceae bacterium]|nr:thioredoxin [Rubricoccaceae bacterium]
MRCACWPDGGLFTREPHRVRVHSKVRNLREPCSQTAVQPTSNQSPRNHVDMADNAKYITVTDANFEQEVLNSDQPVLVDFWATWCGPCRVIAPTIEQLAEEYEGKARIAKLDTDSNPRTPMSYNVRSIPSLIFFKDGAPVDQLIGVVPKHVLAEKLDALVAQEA